MAGCDLLLMPSRYEPCGLPQMYSQMLLGLGPPRMWFLFSRGRERERERERECVSFLLCELRYGTLPIVHATGGLVDSVKAGQGWGSPRPGRFGRGLADSEFLLKRERISPRALRWQRASMSVASTQRERRDVCGEECACVEWAPGSSKGQPAEL